MGNYSRKNSCEMNPSKSALTSPPLFPLNIPKEISVNHKKECNSFAFSCSDVTKCSWAIDFPELRRACLQNKVCIIHEPFKFRYILLPTLLQVGPTCGLVALSILLGNKISAESLLLTAIEKRFTNNGEMLSVKNMNILLNAVKGDINIVSSVNSGSLLTSDVVTFLLNGGMALVPYDSDKNHAPCLRNGHAAHWALIVGIILQEEHMTELVLVKHGKSLRLAIWSLKDLDESNSNLEEFSLKRADDGLEYIIPEGGIGGESGLKNQFILVKFN